MGVWEYGSMGVWEYENMGVQVFNIPPNSHTFFSIPKF
jgi:hypothetical protein